MVSQIETVAVIVPLGGGEFKYGSLLVDRKALPAGTTREDLLGALGRQLIGQAVSPHAIIASKPDGVLYASKPACDLFAVSDVAIDPNTAYRNGDLELLECAGHLLGMIGISNAPVYEPITVDEAIAEQMPSSVSA